MNLSLVAGIIIHIPVYIIIKSTVYCIAHFILLHILLLIFFYLFLFYFYLYLYIFSCVMFNFFALSIERTCPDLHFTTDYILYN